MMNTAQNIRNLLGPVSGVPFAREPVYWDRRLGVRANVSTIESYFLRYQRDLPAGCTFDEAAIMVPNPSVRRALTMELERAGWQLFNKATDLVHTNPFGTRYQVEYRFFQHLERSWRIELMLLPDEELSGMSPLHRALWFPSGEVPTNKNHQTLPIPHLSFKPSPTEVAAVGGPVAVRGCLDHLRAEGYLMAQACQSTYGQFWYLLHNEATRQIYVKPRINTRDAA